MTAALEDKLRSVLSAINSQQDVVSFLESKQGQKVKKLFEQAFALSKDKINIGDLSNDKLSSIFNIISSLYPNDTSSLLSDSNDSDGNNDGDGTPTTGLKILHSWFVVELLLVGAVGVLAPKLLLSLLKLSEPYHASVNESNADTQYQFVRVVGALAICLAIHYIGESNDLKGIKYAAIGRIVFSTIIAYMVKKEWVEKPFSLFFIADFVSGLAAFLKARKLEKQANEMKSKL